MHANPFKYIQIMGGDIYGNIYGMTVVLLAGQVFRAVEIVCSSVQVHGTSRTANACFRFFVACHRRSSFTRTVTQEHLNLVPKYYTPNSSN